MSAHQFVNATMRRLDPEGGSIVIMYILIFHISKLMHMLEAKNKLD